MTKEERISIHSLVEESEETLRIAEKLAEFVKHRESAEKIRFLGATASGEFAASNIPPRTKE